MNTCFKPILLAVGVALAAGPAGAVDYSLAAKAFTKTLPMADGTPVEVAMWGYVIDPDNDDSGRGDCYETTTSVADRLACVDALPDPVIPAPQLTLAAGDTQLRIFVTNALPEPTSILIPGQEMPYSDPDSDGPTWDGGSSADANAGPRCADPLNCTEDELAKRVRSFGREAASNGGRKFYVWNISRSNPFDRPGSFVYHSGTHPQKQVYMGLFGAVTKNAVEADDVAGTPAVAYNDPADGVTPLASTTYDSEVVLFYSDVDPDINNGIACLYDDTGTLFDDDGDTANDLVCGVDVAPYTTSVEMNARWFLINGEPYDPANKADPSMTLAAGAANSPTLVRFFSAASETHVPTLQGLYMTLHAEDGLVYNYQDDTGAHAAPRTQYSVKLPPLKTMDAIIEPSAEGIYAVYDGNGYMTNPSDIDDFTQGDTVGGMLRFLSVGPAGNQPPVVADDAVEVVEGRTVTIDVLANDTDPNGDPLTITNVDTTGTVGTLLCDTANPGGTCDYTADGGVAVTTFTYGATDGTLTNDPPDATVTITVVANAAPLANDDAATTDVTTPVVVNVLANDTDANGDTLTIDSFDTTSVNSATVSCDTATGDCTYTPNAFTGDDTFTYIATDGDLPSGSATVTVTVNAVTTNNPPVAVDDVATTDEDVAVVIAVLANDTDTDGDLLTVTGVSTPANGSAATDGTSVTYTPNANFNGADSFTYDISDGNGGTDTATVSVTVSPVNDAPVAVDDSYGVGEDTVLNVPAPGVLVNDTDVDGDPLTAVLVAGPSGSLTLNADGSFSYTPPTGFTGNDTFTYAANDGTENGNTATVTISVTALNDAPVANADTFVLKSMYAAGEVTTVQAADGVLANDTDPDGDALIAVLDPAVDPAVEPPALLTLSPDGSFTYTTGDSGNLTLGAVDTFTYYANDGTVNSADPATVTLTRELVVSEAVCERRGNGRCDWRIQGQKLNTNNVVVEAWVGGFDVGQRIGRVRTGDAAWTIEANNSNVNNVALDPIDVRVVNDANAEIFGYPVIAQ